MTRISFSANAFPRQLRGPTLNGCEAARLSRWNGEAGSIVEGESHRSGMKSACRWKFNGLFDAVHACTPTLGRGRGAGGRRGGGGPGGG
ncbi:hypothetical protein KXV60_002862, partial [Aspergillus fumigatus]